DFPGDAGLVIAIEIKQDRPVKLAAIRQVKGLLSPPVPLDVEANALVENYVATDGGVKAARLFAHAGAGESDNARVAARTRADDGAEAEHGVGLLGRGKGRKRKEREHKC